MANSGRPWLIFAFLKITLQSPSILNSTAPLPAQAAELALWVAGGHVRALARALTLADNGGLAAAQLMKALQPNASIPLVGITGPPGAGKSTLVNALAGQLLAAGKRVAVLAVDPSSPFHLGALLGDRIRLSAHFMNPNLFIRSVASRGSLGGLSASVLQMADVLRAAPFDWIFVETVGVGQSEIEIAGLADVTVLVLVPEAGDEVQSIKSGIMEVGDLFVVNKADRPGAQQFAAGLRKMLHERPANAGSQEVVLASATQETGIAEVQAAIERRQALHVHNPRRAQLLLERALLLLQRRATAQLNLKDLLAELEQHLQSPHFSFYAWVDEVSGRMI